MDKNQDCPVEVPRPIRGKDESFLGYAIRLAEWEQAVKANNRVIGRRIDAVSKPSTMRNQRAQTRDCVRNQESTADRIEKNPASSFFLREAYVSAQDKKWGTPPKS